MGLFLIRLMCHGVRSLGHNVYNKLRDAFKTKNKLTKLGRCCQLGPTISTLPTVPTGPTVPTVSTMPTVPTGPTWPTVSTVPTKGSVSHKFSRLYNPLQFLC